MTRKARDAHGCNSSVPWDNSNFLALGSKIIVVCGSDLANMSVLNIARVSSDINDVNSFSYLYGCILNVSNHTSNY